MQAALTVAPVATVPPTNIETLSSTDPDPGLGFAQRLLGGAMFATRPVGGLLTTAAQGKDTSAKDLNTRIADWDLRLAARESSYKRQFANLEVMIGKMNQQSEWLAGQLNSLPSY